MTCEEAYELLGLTPWGEFAAAAIERNFEAATDDRDIEEGPYSPLYRRIGTTTWLTVSAALCVLHGNNIGVAGGTSIRDALRLLGDTHKMVREILEKKGISGVQVGHANTFGRSAVFNVSSHNTNSVMSCSEEDVFRYQDGRTWFVESRWKQKLIRCSRGPFAMIQVVKLDETGRYQAFTEDDEFIMTLTAAGAQQAISINGARLV